MNREIKFRAWDVSRETMWYKDTKTVDGDSVTFSFFDGGIGWGIYANVIGNRLVTGDPNSIFNTPGVLMQYTGVKDKNGKEIYEGDILGEVYGNCYISYCDECKQFQLVNNVFGCFACEGDVHWFELVHDKKELEVVGNIYENPELLTNS